MRIFLIFALMSMIYATPLYCIQPIGGADPEKASEKQAAEINKEKEKIMESIAPEREAREKNLSPFVESVKENSESENPFDYAVKADEPENKVTQPKSFTPNSQPKTRINFIAISMILAGFLLVHFFIRPKSKK
jgi:hypothetical protein